ncbi:MAG: DNA polymerase I [Legionellales bacterium]|nr:DNA polymerase I [Legionellales bacterium]
MQKQVVLVDGSGYLFRAFHALPPLTNPEGVPSGAVYGVMNMLRRLDQDYPDAEIVVVFDPPGPTVRHDIFPAYKANRGKMPDDLSVQIAPLHRLIRAKGYPLCIVPEQEADDVIGTLARLYVQSGAMVIICTGDKDFAQLVCENIILLDTMRDQLLDERGVYQKFGVHPHQIVDYLALIGDTSDNIPGVMKVGPKTAVKWLATYGDLASIIDHATELKGKVGEYFQAAIPDLPLYQRLVTICQTLDLPFDWQQLNRQTEDTSVLSASYKELGFKTWLKELALPDLKKPSEFVWIDHLSTLMDRCRRIDPESIVGLSLYEDPLSTESGVSGSVIAVGVCDASGSFVVPCSVMQGVDVFCPWPDVLDVLRETILQATQVVLIETKPIYKQLLTQGFELTHCFHDLTVLAYAIKGPSRLSLSDLVAAYLGDSLPSRDDVLGKGAKRLPLSVITRDQLGALLSDEAAAQRNLWQVMRDLDAEAYRLYDEIDAPLTRILAAMETRGVCIDEALFSIQSDEMAKTIQRLTESAHQLAGQSFNPASVKQLQTILYDHLGLPVIEKTPKGDPSTSESVLMALGNTFELPRVILELRSVSKLKSTYVDALPALAKHGRVHCSFQQTTTATGRLSCQNPNLQNIPIRSEAGRAVRTGFIAPSGYRLVSFDYSQIELRIMAHISKDPALVEAFMVGADVHDSTAAEIFSMSTDEVGPNERRIAKVINFGLIYGMSAFGLAKQLDLDRSTAQAYIDRYFDRYPQVRSYMAEIRAQAIKDGYVRTVLGRKIYLPDIKHQKVSIRKAAERAAINAPMQGTAAELIKCAMIRVADELSSFGDDAYLIIQVHDELIFEVKSEMVDRFLPRIREAMTSVLKLDVPLVVNHAVGDRWGQMVAD